MLRTVLVFEQRMLTLFFAHLQMVVGNAGHLCPLTTRRADAEPFSRSTQYFTAGDKYA